MLTIELPLPGRLTATKTHHGDPQTIHTLDLDGRTLYHLQKLLERDAAPAPDYFAARKAVLLAEELRLAIERGTTHNRTPDDPQSHIPGGNL